MPHAREFIIVIALSNEKLPFVEAYLVYTEFTILYVLDMITHSSYDHVKPKLWSQDCATKL